jgi:hypothetical protein
MIYNPQTKFSAWESLLDSGGSAGAPFYQVELNQKVFSFTLPVCGGRHNDGSASFHLQVVNLCDSDKLRFPSTLGRHVIRRFRPQKSSKGRANPSALSTNLTLKELYPTKRHSGRCQISTNSLCTLRISNRARPHGPPRIFLGKSNGFCLKAFGRIPCSCHIASFPAETPMDCLIDQAGPARQASQISALRLLGLDFVFTYH